MKSIREKIQMSALVLTLPLCCSYSLAATGESINLENDGDGAKMTRFENLNDYRYCEIFMIKKNPDSGDLYGIFYNTTDRNRGAETRDSCPDDLWSKVDIEVRFTESVQEWSALLAV